MKKILIVLLLLTFSYTQNFGILKSKKNKSGLGIVFTLQHSYKGGKEGSNILDVPGQFNFKISYRMKSDIEVFGSITPGKFTYEEEDICINPKFLKKNKNVSKIKKLYNLYKKAKTPFSWHEEAFKIARK